MPSQFALLSRPSFGHLRIPLRAGGIGGELVRVAAVVEGVEDDAEAVAAAGVVVLLQVADDDLRGLHVVREDAEIERIVRVEHSYVRVVGRAVPSRGSVLDEAVRDRRFAPRLLVERAVERNRANRAHRREPLFEVDCVVVDGFRRRAGRAAARSGAAASATARCRDGCRPGGDVLGGGAGRRQAQLWRKHTARRIVCMRSENYTC